MRMTPLERWQQPTCPFELNSGKKCPGRLSPDRSGCDDSILLEPPARAAIGLTKALLSHTVLDVELVFGAISSGAYPHRPKSECSSASKHPVLL